ncbi:3090_t:CDS:1, partial [Gigaspora margarita]
ADKICPNPVMKIHPDHMYSSKLINTRKITESLLNLKVSNPIKSMEIPNDF